LPGRRESARTGNRLFYAKSGLALADQRHVHPKSDVLTQFGSIASDMAIAGRANAAAGETNARKGAKFDRAW
jgi:hypothetical protein